MPKEKPLYLQEAEQWLSNLKMAFEQQCRMKRRERKACADLLYSQYAATQYGYDSGEFWTPGLDEGLAYRYMADEIYRDIGLETLTDSKIGERWHGE